MKINNFLQRCNFIDLKIKEIKKIEYFINKNGGKLFIVGGNVRDLILNRNISSNPDLATDIKTKLVLKSLDQGKIKYSKVGLSFGSIAARISSVDFDITSMRKDIKTDGRWAEIEPTDDILEDASRRDFTINAIYCDTKGNLYDPLNGIDDLRNSRVKFIGEPEKRIKEDYLRILRFFRFTFFYASKLDPDGLKSCEKHKGKIKILSFERRMMELKKILLLENMETKSRILNIRKFIEVTLGCKINYKDFERLCKIERFLDSVCFQRRVKYLIGCNRKPKILFEKIDKKFKERLQVKESFIHYTHQELNAILYFSHKDYVLDQLIFDYLNKVISKKKLSKLVEIVRRFKKKKFPLSGNDLIGRGFHPGKKMGKTLRKVEQWWVKKNFMPTKVDCINFVEDMNSIDLPRNKRR